MPQLHRIPVLLAGLALLAGACARHGADRVVEEPITRLPNPDPGGETLPSTDATLTDLLVSAAPLAPGFAPETFDYTATAPFTAFDTTLTATASDPGAVIEIRGEVVGSGTPSSAIPLAIGETTVSVHVTAADGRTSRIYVVRITRTAPELDLVAYGKATNTDAGDRFGSVLALDGDTLAVGAPYEDSSAVGVQGAQANNGAHDAGAVYVYVRSGTDWVPQAYLKAHNASAGDRFGSALSLEGDRLVVGAPGEDSSASGPLGNGQGLGFDDDCPESGAAYVFERSAGTWAQTGYLKGPGPSVGDAFGSAVALAAPRIAVGMPYDDDAGSGIGTWPQPGTAPDSGAVVTFRLGAAGWESDAVFKAPFSETGDLFGSAVALRGEALIVGAPGDDGADNLRADAGAVHVYRNGTGWVQGPTLRAPSPDPDDRFGAAISASGPLLAIGAPGDDSAAIDVGGDPNDNGRQDAGAVFLYRDAPHTWTLEAFVKAPNGDVGDQFGSSLAVGDNVLVIGAPFERSAATGIDGNASDNSLYGAGAAYVYALVNGSWEAVAYLKATRSDVGDLFGNGVAADAASIAIGARKEDGAGVGFGADPADNLAQDAGAVFVFTAR